MEAASVHHLPRQAGIDEHGEVEEGMPTSLPDAWDVIRTLERKFRAACGQLTRLQNALEEKRLGEIDAKDIMDILVNWRDVVGKDPLKVQLVAGGKRWERIRARRHDRLEGRGPWTVEELKLVPRGALESDWHAGRDPKTGGKTYLEVETIYRDAEQVEKFVALARAAEDRALDERLAAFYSEHPSLVYDAIVRERQVDQLKSLAPCAFEPKPSELRDTSFEEYPDFEQRQPKDGAA